MICHQGNSVFPQSTLGDWCANNSGKMRCGLLADRYPHMHRDLNHKLLQANENTVSKKEVTHLLRKSSKEVNVLFLRVEDMGMCTVEHAGVTK